MDTSSKAASSWYNGRVLKERRVRNEACLMTEGAAFKYAWLFCWSCGNDILLSAASVT